MRREIVIYSDIKDPADSKGVTIVERRLCVGCHNGRSFVGSVRLPLNASRRDALVSDATTELPGEFNTQQRVYNSYRLHCKLMLGRVSRIGV